MKKYSARLWCVLLLLLFSTSLIAVTRPDIASSEIQLNNLTVDQLQQAAEAGDPDAQYALGYLYYYGKNVSQNTQTALNWIKRASVQGQEQATQALVLLGAQNTAFPSKVNNSTVAAMSVEPAASLNSAVASVMPTMPETMPTSVPSKKSVGKVDGSSATLNVQQLATAPSSSYTIQLLGSSNKHEIIQYSTKYNLGNNTTYYTTKHKGKNWYVLVYGLYKTPVEAQQAIKQLPAVVRSQKPWAKSLKQIQPSLKN